MKFTLSWLKDHLDTNASVDDISKKLTAIGLEVESITDHSEALKPFTVAKVLQADKHPEADKLRVCRVHSDAGELQIVCGAANARAGIYVALAKEGAVIPGNGMIIKKTKIRGVESNGMLCSAEELGLEDASEGIIELPEAPIGSPVASAMGLNDPVIEIAITPNRADCLGVRGIARDLSAAGLGILKDSGFRAQDSEKGAFVSPITVRIDDMEGCLQFIGCSIRGAKNGESPAWLQQRLKSIGQRTISALVDITNYFTFDLGRPLHVYDAKNLNGHVCVRKSIEGETLKALNGKDYTLPDGICVIADNKSVLAIGGVIGGEPTGCTETTTDVFLEVALFNPAFVARSGRQLQIDSDARYRFERGVDFAFLEEGAQRAVSMILELCGGEASPLVRAGKTPEWKREIDFNPERVATLGGVDIAATKAESILKALGFTCATSATTWKVTPPSWRQDVEGEADVVEEVLRIHGYDAIPTVPLPKLPTISPAALTPAQKRVHVAKRLLASRGMLEVCSWSFIPSGQAALFGGGKEELKLLNPINSELDMMRPSLLPNLLEAAKRNAARGFKSVSLFEVGLQFHDTSETGQRMVTSGIRSGFTDAPSYKDALYQTLSRSIDSFDAKQDAVLLLQSLGLSKYDIGTSVPAWYHPGRSGALMLGGKIILGYFGEIHPAILAQLDVDGPVVAFELFLDAIPQSKAKSKAKPALKLSDYQAVERDFAFIVGENVSAADMLKSINQADKQLITDARIFDVYAGKGVEERKKSVAVNVTLQAPDRTLSEAEINGVCKTIVDSVTKQLGGVLRQ